MVLCAITFSTLDSVSVIYEHFLHVQVSKVLVEALVL